MNKTFVKIQEKNGFWKFHFFLAIMSPHWISSAFIHTEFYTKSFRKYFHIDSISLELQTLWTADFIFSLPNCLFALCWQGWIHSILFLEEKITRYWNYCMIFSLFGGIVNIFFPCLLLIQLLPFFCHLLKKGGSSPLVPLKEVGKVWNICKSAWGHMRTARSSPARLSPNVLPVMAAIHLQPLWASLRQHSLSC